MAVHKIAVAIPTYKRKELLQRLIASVPNDWHIVVSDNESSLAPLAESLGSNVRVSHSPTLVPMFANWNRALSLVDTDSTHVFIPSDDDLFLPSAQKVVERTLATYPDADIYVFGCDFFDEHDRRWKGYCPAAKQYFAQSNGFLTFAKGVDARMPGILMRKAFLDQIGTFDERFELTAADSELVQRALLLGTSVFIPEVIGLYRIWTGSLTHARQATDLWMQEVDLWTGKIAELLLAGHLPPRSNVDIDRYRAEIFALNLLAGLRNLIAKRQFQEARNFLRRHPMPQHTTLQTRLRMLRTRWQLWRALA